MSGRSTRSRRPRRLDLDDGVRRGLCRVDVPRSRTKAASSDPPQDRTGSIGRRRAEASHGPVRSDRLVAPPVLCQVQATVGRKQQLLQRLPIRRTGHPDGHRGRQRQAACAERGATDSTADRLSKCSALVGVAGPFVPKVTVARPDLRSRAHVPPMTKSVLAGSASSAVRTRGTSSPRVSRPLRTAFRTTTATGSAARFCCYCKF